MKTLLEIYKDLKSKKSNNTNDLEEERVDEGNPLSRLTKYDKEGRHTIIMSAERKKDNEGKQLTSQQNSDRMNKLKSSWREKGYGFRNTEGKWNEGEGVGKESSIHVAAKEPGKKGAAELRKHARELSKKYDQDAFIHRTPEGKGTAINTVGKRAGQKDDYGPSRYNVNNPYGETTYKTKKPENKRPKLTFRPKEDD
jgi:hypothetical protein